MQQILNKLDTSSWESYKHSLGQAMEVASDMGISENQITQFAHNLAVTWPRIFLLTFLRIEH